MHNLALLSLPIGVILNLIAIAVLGFYRIDKGSHEANLEALRPAAATVTRAADRTAGPWRRPADDPRSSDAI